MKRSADDNVIERNTIYMAKSLLNNIPKTAGSIEQFPPPNHETTILNKIYRPHFVQNVTLHILRKTYRTKINK